jgi:hypothetical protein
MERRFYRPKRALKSGMTPLIGSFLANAESLLQRVNQRVKALRIRFR